MHVEKHPSVVDDYCVLAMSQGTELQKVCEEMVTTTIQPATLQMPVVGLIPRALSSLP